MLSAPLPGADEAAGPAENGDQCAAQCSWCHRALPTGQCCFARYHARGEYPWHACGACLFGSRSVAAHHLRAENGGNSLQLIGLTIPETWGLLSQGLNRGPSLVEDALTAAGLRRRSRSPTRQSERHALCHEPCTICNARWCGRAAGHQNIHYPQHCCPHCWELRLTAYSRAAQTGTASSSTERPAAVPIGGLPLICQVCNEPIEPTQDTRRCRYVATSVGRHCGATVHQCCFRSSHDQCLNCRLEDAEEEEEL